MVKLKTNETFTEMVDTTVRVEYSIDVKGDIIINYDSVIGPSMDQLLEDLLDRLTEPDNNSACDMFRVTDEDEDWLEVWNVDWREVIYTQELFCGVCRHHSRCFGEERGLPHVQEKIQEESKKVEGKSEKKKGGNGPFRKLLRRPKS